MMVRGKGISIFFIKAMLKKKSFIFFTPPFQVHCTYMYVKCIKNDVSELLIGTFAIIRCFILIAVEIFHYIIRK